MIKKKTLILIFVGVILIGIIGGFIFKDTKMMQQLTPQFLKGETSKGLTDYNGTAFGILSLGSKWIVYDSTGEYETYIENADDKKTHIGWYLKEGINELTTDTTDKVLYDCSGKIILDDKDKLITLKYETNKVPNIDKLDGMSNGYFIALTDASAINIDSCVKLNPTVVYQNISQVTFIENDLTINNTLKKWNGLEFVISPEDIWIEEPDGDNFKFGANDTLAKEDTLYQYEWVSNKEIKQDEKGYYYFDEYKTDENQISNIYTRRILDVSDVCIEGANCVYSLTNYYNEGFTSSKLIMNFTGFYNSTLDMVFIDPSYTHTDISLAKTLEVNVRSEPTYSHLSIYNESIVLYMPFDAQHISNNITYDYSIYNNDGTVTNAVWNSTGKYGGAYEFDGDGDYVDVGDMEDMTEGIAGLTISQWVKASEINSNHKIIINKEGGGADTFFLYWENDQDINFIVYNNSNNAFTGTYTDGITDTNWHYIVGIYNGTNILVYVDGVIGGIIGNLTGLTQDSVLNVIIANPTSSYLSGEGGWNGSIDEVAIWNRSLSTDEITALYQGTYKKFYNQGNQTFELQNVSLGTDNRVNVTVTGQAINDSSLNVALWEANYSSIVNDDLVLYMHLDNLSAYGENDTHVYDFSGNNNNGTVTSAIPTSSGKLNGAMSFDGSGDYITVADSDELDGSSTMSWSFWVKLANTENSNKGLMNKYVTSAGGRSYNIYIDSAKDLRLQISSDGSNNEVQVADTTIPDTNWHHVVLVFDSGTFNSYMDGQSVSVDGDFTTELSIYGGTDSLDIGRTYGGISFNGSIDEVMIFNRSLSADEVKSIYLTGSTNHRNDGSGIDWNLAGEKQLTTYGTQLQASNITVSPNSNYLLTEIVFNSTNGFYSPILFNATIDSWEEGGEPPVVDNEYPIFSTYYDNNATLIDTGTGLFNVTITSTNGTVLLEIDGNNITATNITADVYNASYDFTSSGVYDYRWHSWGNGTNHNYNVSDERSYTVNSSAVNCWTKTNNILFIPTGCVYNQSKGGISSLI